MTQVQSGDKFIIRWRANLDIDGVKFYTLYTNDIRTIATITPDGVVTRLGPLSDGENILSLTATDQAGNESEHSNPAPNIIVKVPPMEIEWVVE